MIEQLKNLHGYVFQNLIPLINECYLQEKCKLADFGIGKIGFDFSQHNNFVSLAIYYDASIDVFLINYKAENSIVNDLELQICIDEKEILPIIVLQLKEEAIKDLAENKI
ncbi:hypothetical protein ELAN111203_14495 [Elizabethkingia anophelis]